MQLAVGHINYGVTRANATLCKAWKHISENVTLYIKCKPPI